MLPPPRRRHDRGPCSDSATQHGTNDATRKSVPMSLYATQDEILFKSGVDFEVVDYDKLSDGSYTIKLRQRE